MNSKIKQMCIDPRTFGVIQIYVHNMPKTEDMREAILSIAVVNPYLAAYCYATSEEDLGFKRKILNKIREFEASSVQEGLMLFGALDVLGEYNDSIRVAFLCIRTTGFKKSNKYYQELSDKYRITRWIGAKVWAEVDEYWRNYFLQNLFEKDRYYCLARELAYSACWNKNRPLFNNDKEASSFFGRLIKENRIDAVIVLLTDLGYVDKVETIIDDYKSFFKKICASSKRNYRGVYTKFRKKYQELNSKTL